MELAEILPQLTAYFPPEDHKERKLKGGGTWYYLPHQVIRDRLNEVCPGEWSTDYSLAQVIDGEPIYLCKLTICGITRTGIGDKSNEPSMFGTSAQRAFRKAFTDAAEQFGIAAYLDEQTNPRTKQAFVRHMQRSGRGDVAVNYQRNEGKLPDRTPRKDPPPTPFGQPAPKVKPNPQPPKAQPAPIPTPSSLPDRAKALIDFTKHEPDQVKMVCESYGLPTRSSSFTSIKQIEKLRDELFVDWGNSQGKFKNIWHCRKSYEKLLKEELQVPDPSDELIWEAWQAKVLAKEEATV